MIKIKLNEIFKENGKYIVQLDHENRFEFENKRLAKDFLNKIEKELTNILVFINDEYCCVHEMYRQYFFILEDFKRRYNIESSIEFIKDKITLILFRSGGENRNYIVTNGIENMLFELKSVYSLLNHVAISRSDTTIRHKIVTKCRVLDLFLKDFRNFEEEIKIKRIGIGVERSFKLRKIS